MTPSKKEVICRPMTDDEKKAANLLNLCTFAVDSWDKRFAGNMSAIAHSEVAEITEKQARNLWRMFYRFRNQILNKPQVRGNGYLFNIARPIYEEEKAKLKRPDDLQKLKEWNEAAQ